MLARANALAWAIERGDADASIAEKRKAFDESTVTWETRQIMVPSIVRATTSGSPITVQHVLAHDIPKVYMAVDQCLHHALGANSPSNGQVALRNCPEYKYSTWKSASTSIDGRIEQARYCILELQMAMDLRSRQPLEEADEIDEEFFGSTPDCRPTAPPPCNANCETDDTKQTIDAPDKPISMRELIDSFLFLPKDEE
jgi:hypothetical protein